MAARTTDPVAASCSGRGRPSGRAGRWIFLAAGLALFAASAVVLVEHGTSMPAGHMSMAGGPGMHATGMHMPGRHWPGTAACFLGMWVPMTVAMMLPAVLPVLWRYHLAAAQAGRVTPGLLSLLAGLAYFLAWTLAGLALYPVGAALASTPLPARAMERATGVVVLLAGLLQFTGWKARLLACCRATPRHGVAPPAGAVAALRYGLRLGLHCIGCCAGATGVLFALGWMDLRVMAAVTAAVTIERLAPGGVAAMRAVGLVAIVAGAILLGRA